MDGLQPVVHDRERHGLVKFVSLFAGVGGFDLGFERAGMECVGQVEIDKHARGVLDRHWPDVPKHEDVTTAIGWADERGLVGNVDLVCGGFPCQDVSVAGRRAGLAGERTGLFWEALAFATHVEAKWIVLENVPGLLTSNQGRDFGVVLTALADAGYVHLEWRVCDSQFFGVPQRRRRVFIVGCTSVPRRRPVLVERESLRGDSSQGNTSRKDAAEGTDGSTGVNPRGFTPGGFGNYREGIGTLRANGGDLGGGVRGTSGLVGALCARDFKGVGSQYVAEGKLVIVDGLVREIEESTNQSGRRDMDQGGGDTYFE